MPFFIDESVVFRTFFAHTIIGVCNKKSTAPFLSFEHPFPKGRGERYLYSLKLVIGNTNFSLAPWGEGVRRTGEGPFIQRKYTSYFFHFLYSVI